MAMIKCKECNQEVSSDAKACPHCGKKLRMGGFKKLLLGVGAFVLLMIVIGSFANSNSGPATSSNSDESTTQPDTPKQWVEIASLTGTGDKKGPTFTLTGAEAKIKYEIRGDMVVLAVYVVQAGTDIMQTGGIPEVMEQASGSGESAIHGKRGEYYLNVTGMGEWKVSVEEHR